MQSVFRPEGFVKKGVFLFVLLLVAATGSAFATNVELGVAGGYSAFIFNNFTGSNSDVTGSLAVGGNVSLTSYSVGKDNPSGTNLVAGGNLTLTYGTINGNVVLGGTSSITGANITGKIAQKDGTLPIDFSYMADYLTNESGLLAKTATTGTASMVYGGIALKGDGSSSVQVFNIDANDLYIANGWKEITAVPLGSTLVINVSGKSVTPANVGMNALSGYNVLFNFYEAKDVSIISFTGNVLAPYASVTGVYGQINGTVIAKDWSGTTEFHYVPFADTDTSAPVPEPGTVIMLSSGLAGLAVLTKRTKRKKF
jgi:choice-of-anchor A domain-containing protein